MLHSEERKKTIDSIICEIDPPDETFLRHVLEQYLEVSNYAFVGSFYYLWDGHGDERVVEYLPNGWENIPYIRHFWMDKGELRSMKWEIEPYGV